MEDGTGNIFFGLFDGHGGPEVADWVSRNIVNMFKENGCYKEGNWERAFKETFVNVDAALKSEEVQKDLIVIAKQKRTEAPILMHHFGARNDDKSAAGCTATCILLTPTQIICANAGDSRSVLSMGGGPKNGDGTAVDLSDDHRPTVESEKARIEASGKTVSKNGRINGTLAVSRGFGDFHYKDHETFGPE